MNFDVPVSQMPDVEIRVSDQHADAFIPNQAVVLAEVPFGARRLAGWVPVSRAVLDDAVLLHQVVDIGMDRVFRPWRYPDRNPFPTFEPFPRLARVATALRRVGRR